MTENAVVPRTLIKLYRRLLGELNWIEAPPKTMERAWRGGRAFKEGALERAERAIEIREHLVHIAYVIRLYIPDWDSATAEPIRPHSKQSVAPPGGWGEATLDVLRETEEPLAISEIIAAICERYEIDYSSVKLREQYRPVINGVLKRLSGVVVADESEPRRWALRRQ